MNTSLDFTNVSKNSDKEKYAYIWDAICDSYESVDKIVVSTGTLKLLKSAAKWLDNVSEGNYRGMVNVLGQTVCVYELTCINYENIIMVGNGDIDMVTVRNLP